MSLSISFFWAHPLTLSWLRKMTLQMSRRFRLLPRNSQRDPYQAQAPLTEPPIDDHHKLLPSLCPGGSHYPRPVLPRLVRAVLFARAELHRRAVFGVFSTDLCAGSICGGAQAGAQETGHEFGKHGLCRLNS